MIRAGAIPNTLWPILRTSALLCLLSFAGSILYAEVSLRNAPANDYETLVVLVSLAGAALGAALAGIAREQNWRTRFFVLVATPLFALVLLRAVTALFAPFFMSHIFVALLILIFYLDPGRCGCEGFK